MVKDKIKLKDHYLKIKIMAVKNYLIILLLTLFLIFI